MSERVATVKPMVEDTVILEVQRTKRVTVTIPTITESSSSRRLRQKNRKVVESLTKNNQKMFTF